jgi:polysaccharide deacetylase family protein (PEP-CTERM system associated)
VIQAHHFSVDVEEYFHPTALQSLIPQSSWEELPRRSNALVPKILELLGERGARCTFFTLGWLAQREPATVRAIADAGHEIASHGWDHQKVNALTPKAFREDLRRSSGLLQDLIGERVVGYRAPSFSIVPGTEWALDVLLEEGFLYDSSMFPIRIHPGYGYPSVSPDPHLIHRAGGRLAEIPPATLRLGSLLLPAAGGAYLRFFPGALIKSAIRSADRRGAPATLYVHPWEFDSEMPRFKAPLLTQLRMRRGIRTVPRKVSSLLHGYSFRPMRETAKELLGTCAGGNE